MSVFCFGSINLDHVYRVPHLPMPGETLAATGYAVGLGGKGANQSVAAARAGSRAVHIGAVGPDGETALAQLNGFGVDVSHVTRVETATGHAIINVDEAGENAIVVYAGANRYQSLTKAKTALDAAGKQDLLLIQNETSLQADVAAEAKRRGLFVVYSAAPFAARAVMEMMAHADLMVMNEVEARQLTEELSSPLSLLPVPNLLVTRGAKGAIWHMGDTVIEVPAFLADAVDTTGAGDCFVGTVVAGLDQGEDPKDAMRLGAAAAALQVMRPGAAEAMPMRADVDAFLEAQAG